jgi:G3E family GTPase
VAATTALLRGVNPAAPIHHTVRAQIDVSRLLGVRAYAAPPELPPPHGHDHDHDEPGHEHAPEPTHYELRGISSLLVPVPVLSPARLDALDEWVRTVLWDQRLPGDTEAATPPLIVLRCKGLFVLHGGAQYVLQGVRSMYEIAEAGDALGVPDVGKLVLIGTGLDARVRASLESVWA